MLFFDFPSQEELVLPCSGHFQCGVGKGAGVQPAPVGDHTAVPSDIDAHWTWTPLQIFDIKPAT